MKKLAVSLWAESLKVRKSRVFWISLVFFIFIAFMMGLMMYIQKHPELSEKLGLIGTKASILDLGENDWQSYFGLLIEILAGVGLIGFGFVTAWVFGREYTDHTLKDILAMPVSRTSIVISKLIVVVVWSLLLSAGIFRICPYFRTYGRSFTVVAIRLFAFPFYLHDGEPAFDPSLHPGGLHHVLRRRNPSAFRAHHPDHDHGQFFRPRRPGPILSLVDPRAFRRFLCFGHRSAEPGQFHHPLRNEPGRIGGYRAVPALMPTINSACKKTPIAALCSTSKNSHLRIVNSCFSVIASLALDVFLSSTAKKHEFSF